MRLVYPFLALFNFFFVVFLAFIYLTIDGVTSEGSRLMVGNGASPPVNDQGIPL